MRTVISRPRLTVALLQSRGTAQGVSDVVELALAGDAGASSRVDS